MRQLKLGAFMAAILGLSACGGGGASSESDVASDTQNKGSIGILLTDAPADPDTFEQINITIQSIELLAGDSRVNVYQGEPQSIDLLSLRNESIPFAFNSDIPTGEYCKIRLTLEELELVIADQTPDDLDDNPRAYPRLPGNNKLDLNVRDCFEIESDQILTLQLDIDAGKSIHITGNNKYQFRPVVFVDAIAQDFTPKLLRLSGILEAYDESLDTLLLCEALPFENDVEGCVEINVTEDSAYFDNVDFSGTPQNPANLFDEAMLGSSISIAAWPLATPPREDAGYGDTETPVISADAITIEYGAFLTLEGRSLEDSNESGVNIEVLKGNPVNADDLLVALQSGTSAFNGTRIITKHGEFLNYEALILDSDLEVDGVLSLENDEPQLLASLIIVENTENTSRQLTGTIDNVATTSLLLQAEDENACDSNASSIEVLLNSEVDILTVRISDEGSEVELGGELSNGQEVGINGSCSNGQFLATSIVIVEDDREN